MFFAASLQSGILIHRYKRFLADIELDSGEKITAHCPNTGPMTGIAESGDRVWVQPKKDGKLAYTWEITQKNGHFIGVNTHTPARLFQEAFNNGSITYLKGCSALKAEVSIGSSRLDFSFKTTEGETGYIEIKNVHLKRGETALFPDTITSRGTKHLKLITNLASQGRKVFFVFIIQRDDCKFFRIAGDIDPDLADAFKSADGVEFFAHTCKVSAESIILKDMIPVLEPAYA